VDPHTCLPKQWGRRAFRSSGAARLEKKPWYYEMSFIFSKGARQERARKLKEEATRGRFFELNEIKENGGKIFEADMDILDLDNTQAIAFPDVEVWPLVTDAGEEALTTVSLSDKLAGKVSLVTVCARDIARPMVNTWVEAFSKKVSPNDRLQIVQLSFVEGALYKLFRKMMLRSIKGRMADDQHHQVMVAFADSEPFR